MKSISLYTKDYYSFKIFPPSPYNPRFEKTKNQKIEETLSWIQTIVVNRKLETEMRDLYNRKEKSTHWINKAKTELNEPDRTHVLQFVEYLQEKDNSILWIVRCITALT
jgi:hypothetical protein